MEVFVAVIEAGGMAAAARRLDITAQMVGRYVQALEERLGATLIVRTTRRQHMTEVGHEYYTRCKRILDEINKADSEVAIAKSEPRGMLRITAPITLGTACIAPAIVEFLERNPQVNVDLRLDDSISDMVGDGFDVAIRVGTLGDSGVIARALAPYRFMACATPAYIKSHGAPQSVDDLRGHRTIGFSQWRRFGGLPMAARLSNQGPMPEFRMTCNVGAALRTAALRGAGIVFQPEVLVKEDIDTGRLVQVLNEEMSFSMAVHVVYLRDRLRLPKVKSFVDFIVEKFSKSLTM